MNKRVPHPVSAEQWDRLKAFKQNHRHSTMELDNFCSFWEVSHQELADICECSLSTVERWFLNPTSPHRREPTEIHKQNLALAHYHWLSKTNPRLAQKLNQLDKLYQRIQELESRILSY